MAEQKWGYEGEGKAFDVELSGKAIWGAMITVVLVSLLGIAVARGVFSFLLSDMEASDPPPPVRAEALDRRLPPEPWLQAQPEEELVEMRDADEAVLHGYAWEDESQGIVRVPVQRAMEMIAEHGLPVWPEVDAEGQPVQTSTGGEQ